MPEVRVPETFVETLLNNELCPSNTVEYQCNDDAVEQQAACELADNDAGESGFPEEQELFLPQDNFTLILEGDEEAEIEETTELHSFPSKPASPKSEGDHVNNMESDNQEPVTNSVSTVTSDQMSQNTAKVLPYVPEPIKMAIAENLLDIIKDTRNKEFSSEVVEESVHKSINKKLQNSPQDPIQNIPEINKEMKINQVEDIVTSSKGTTGQTAESVNVLLPDDQLLTKMSKPDMLVLPTRRSTRRGKDTSDIPENCSHSSKRKPQEQQLSHGLAFPVRGTENTEECDLEISADVHPVAQEFQATITTRRGVRKSKELVSEFLTHPSEQPASALKRASENTRSLVGDQEGNQFIIGHTIQMTVNPKSARQLNTIAFKLAENVISDQEAVAEEKKQSVTPRRGRPKKHGVLEVPAHTKTQSEKLQLPSSVRRGRSRSSSLLEAVREEGTPPSEPQLPTQTRQERAQSATRAENVSGQETEVTEQQTVRRKRGRPRKNPLNVSADSKLVLSLTLSPPLLPSPQLNVESFVASRRNTRSAALNKSTTALDTPKRRSRRLLSASVEKTVVEKSVPEEPSDALASARSSEKRWSKMTAIKKKCKLSSLPEESTEVKPLPQATDNVEGLQSTDVTKLRLGEMQKTAARHGSHVERTRYSKKSMKQSLSLDGDEPFFFSPPLTKLTEKPKGNQHFFKKQI